MKKWTAVLLIAVLLAGVLAGCAGSKQADPGTNQQTTQPADQPQSSQPQTGSEKSANTGPQVLKMRLMGDIEGLDPAGIRSPHENFLAWNIFNSLVAYVPGSAEVAPQLAEDYKVSEDGKLLTFYLRKGVQFHKGYGELTSEDVKFSFERIMDPETKSRYRTDFAAVDRIETPDQYTVEIYLKEPQPSFIPGALTFRPGWIVSKKAVEELGDKFALNPIGTGPFVFDHYINGTEGVLKANPDYWEGRPKLDEVVFIPILKDDVAEIAVKNGDIALAHVRDPEVYTRMKADSAIKVEEAVSTGIWNLYMNMSKGVMQDLRVRQAVAHAIDRDALTETVLEGIAVAGDSVLNPNFPYYTKDVKRYEPDPAKAQELLKAAGKEGAQIKLVVSTLAPWPLLAPVLKQQLEDAGFKVELVLTEYGAWFDFIANNDYDIAAMGIVRPPIPDVVLANVHSNRNGTNGNFSHYGGVDELVARVPTLPEDQKGAIYTQIQQKVAEDVPLLPLFYLKVLILQRPGVENFPVGIQNDVWLLETTVSK